MNLKSSILLLVTLLVSGCTGMIGLANNICCEYETRTKLSTCKDGDFYLNENVSTKTGIRGGVDITLKFSLEGATNKRMLGKVYDDFTDSPSIYNHPRRDQYKFELQKPIGRQKYKRRITDMALWMNPSDFTLEEFHNTGECLQANLKEIDKIMKSSRDPQDLFEKTARGSQRLVSLRYFNPDSLTKTYTCADGKILDLYLDGDFRLRPNWRLMASVKNYPEAIYWVTPRDEQERLTQAMNDFQARMQGCKDEEGKSAAEEFTFVRYKRKGE